MEPGRKAQVLLRLLADCIQHRRPGAHSGCVVTLQRLRSMDFEEGFTGAELDLRLVSLAEKTAAALAGREPR